MDADCAVLATAFPSFFTGSIGQGCCVSRQGISATCSGGRVTGLSCSSYAINGAIPASISGLSALQTINFLSCGVTGSIPDSIGQLTALTSLSISGNALSGYIPSSISSLTSLRDLNLSQNSLIGEIPDGIGNLKTLSNLGLDGNQLSGSIPSSLGSITGLANLNLKNNQLSGSIPESFVGFTRINIDLSSNQLSGPLPTSLSQWKLSGLSFNGNCLTGSLPSNIAAIYPYALNNQRKDCAEASTADPTAGGVSTSPGSSVSSGGVSPTSSDLGSSGSISDTSSSGNISGPAPVKDPGINWTGSASPTSTESPAGSGDSNSDAGNRNLVALGAGIAVALLLIAAIAVAVPLCLVRRRRRLRQSRKEALAKTKPDVSEETSLEGIEGGSSKDLTSLSSDPPAEVEPQRLDTPSNSTPPPPALTKSLPPHSRTPAWSTSSASTINSRRSTTATSNAPEDETPGSPGVPETLLRTLGVVVETKPSAARTAPTGPVGGRRKKSEDVDGGVAEWLGVVDPEMEAAAMLWEDYDAADGDEADGHGDGSENSASNAPAWTAEEVAAFLRAARGVPEATVKAFQDRNVTGAVLMDLTPATLETFKDELGTGDAGVRDRLLLLVIRLRFRCGLGMPDGSGSAGILPLRGAGGAIGVGSRGSVDDATRLGRSRLPRYEP